MKVLGVAGSPRRGGNTDILLEQAMAGAGSLGAEVETVVLSNLKISPCIHCDECQKEGKCVIKDDMQTIYPKLREADRLIIASPVYFMGLAAQTKTMIDRCQALWAIKYVLHQKVPTNSCGERKGLFISVGGTGFRNLFEPSIVTIKSFFTVLDVSFAGEITFAKVDSKGAIRQNPGALRDAFDGGRRLVGGS